MYKELICLRINYLYYASFQQILLLSSKRAACCACFLKESYELACEVLTSVQLFSEDSISKMKNSLGRIQSLEKEN